MTALPAELPSRLSNSHTIRSAYSIATGFERSAQTHSDPKRLIYARILGYLILEGPSDRARIAVAQEVISCDNEDELSANGKAYYNHYVHPFKKTKGLISTPVSHLSPPSFDTCKEMVLNLLVETPKTHRDAKQNALIRDGFCCVVTGNYDMSIVDNNRELGEIADKEGKGTVTTNCAHIFAESSNVNISGDNEGSSKRDWAASMWAVMDRFGYGEIPSDLNGSNIYRLENVLTLGIDVRSKFDQLKLWFEPGGPPDTYKLKAPNSRHISSHYKTTVTFTTPDPKKLPLPSPEYLGIHAACARVAHLSGAGQHIDKILMELEDTRVLSQDSASAEALEHALLPLQTHIGRYH